MFLLFCVSGTILWHNSRVKNTFYKCYEVQNYLAYPDTETTIIIAHVCAMKLTFIYHVSIHLIFCAVIYLTTFIIMKNV